MDEVSITVDLYHIHQLISGAAELASSFINTAFSWSEQHYRDNPEEWQEWLVEHYNTVASANTLIAAAISVVDVALVNGDIELTAIERGILPDDGKTTSNMDAPQSGSQ